MLLVERIDVSVPYPADRPREIQRYSFEFASHSSLLLMRGVQDTFGIRDGRMKRDFIIDLAPYAPTIGHVAFGNG